MSTRDKPFSIVETTNLYHPFVSLVMVAVTALTSAISSSISIGGAPRSQEKTRANRIVTTMEAATHAIATIAMLSPLSVRLANSPGIEVIMIA